MDELEKEKNKIKKSARKVSNQSTKDTREEIKENYEIGIEYFMNLDEYEDLKKL